MLGYLNSVAKTKQKYVSVSRPRRFGKTIATDMICAYYDRNADSRDLFKKRKLARNTGWDEYLGKFDVIRLVLTDFFKLGKTLEDALAAIKNRVLLELEESYPGTKYDSSTAPKRRKTTVSRKRGKDSARMSQWGPRAATKSLPKNAWS